MKKNKITAAVLAIMLTLTVIPFTSAVSEAAVGYMPDVTKEMCNADFWADRVYDSQKCMAGYDEIKAINEKMCAKGAPMYDLANWFQETYSGVELNESLQKSATADASYTYHTYAAQYDDDGQWISWEDAWETIYTPIVANCADPDAREVMPVKYAICTNRTCLQGFPSERDFFDDPTDPDFNYKNHTMMKVNEPLVLKGKSADGKYYFATASCLTGWVPTEDVAICKSKQEWLEAWNVPADKRLIVIDDKIYTEDSKYAPELANRKLPMGTCLELADEKDWTNRIANRSAHNNHVVWMPVRNNDGTYKKELALIGENRKVTEGYLPLTAENILKVAFNQLGDVYGWGGMLGSEDCSGYIRDVYSCFGLNMCRSARVDHKNLLKIYDFQGMTDAEKTEIISKLPPGTLLSFNGHEMMYLGSCNNKLYVISSVSSVMLNDSRARIRNCVVNTLEIKRANGKTWLSELTYAELPYMDASAEPVIAVPTTNIKSLKAAKKAFTVKWNRKSVTGYQIQYSRDSSFRNAKKVTVCTAKSTSKKISTLKAKKKYYVRTRCYINDYGTTYYSKWSKVKSVRTK